MTEENIKCPNPECDSENIKKSGPFSPAKKDGEEYKEKPHPSQYHCWDCGHDWSDK